MKIKSIAFCLLAAGLLSTSCIREDHTDCYNIYCLELSYTGDGLNEIFPQKIDRVEMYVFDESNTCVSSSLLPEADVKSRMTQLPPLEPGTYKIVCLGNTHETTVEKLASGNYDEINFAASKYRNGETVSGNDELYWASMNYEIAPYDEKKQVETKVIKFASSHYDVSVDVEGSAFLETTSGEPGTIELEGVLPLTDFQNSAEGTPTTYVMKTVKSGSNSMSALNSIMRHQDHSAVDLVIRDGYGHEVARVNFADHIEKYDIDTKLHECIIPFKVIIDSFGQGIKITVPSWFVVEVKPEF